MWMNRNAVIDFNKNKMNNNKNYKSVLIVR